MPNFLTDYSLNLLRGQMLEQLTLGGISGGMSLLGFTLGQPARRSGREMMNDALTGLMRSDAAMLRQGAKNLDQGKALLETGIAALESMQAQVERMRDIVGQFRAGEGTADLGAEYANLNRNLNETLGGTSFNGLKLFDGSGWDEDERVQTDGNVGRLELQAGQSQHGLTLYDLSEHKDIGYNKITNPDNPSQTELADQDAELAGFAQRLAGIQESYQARSGLLASEGAALERQADILQEATRRAGSQDQQTMRQILMELLLREQGGLADAQA
ncbi:MAG: hypothetical protein FWG17_06415 [Desulfovibrionaceae bacterium]|nr:hypothetical protein [Desulfovibrionaceae bacterium]